MSFAAMKEPAHKALHPFGQIPTYEEGALNTVELPILELANAFSAGDLMMVSVLLRARAATTLLDDYPNVAAYLARGEARPAHQRAFAAQLAVFTAHAAPRR